MELTAALLVHHLDAVAATFAPNELAFLALTSKVELPLRDRLAWSLHTELWPTWVVAREWHRTDLAILRAARPDEAGLLLEAKAMYTFDAVSARQLALYAGYIKEDMRKAKIQSATASVFGLLLATHPLAVADRSLKQVIKYLPGVSGAITRLGSAEAVRTAAAVAVTSELSPLGPVAAGSFDGGTAFGIKVAIDYWLVGPV